ncbi:MAG: hypothetical protein HY744_31085 [Deltaproteobacteria bacterium]|nr:hypothetical protein [Deltaproteobacteria bacterium]
MVLCASWGCGGDKDGMVARIDRLRSEIVELRAASLALQDRVEALEARGRPEGPARPAGGKAEPAAPGRPALPVVRIGPEPETNGAAPALAPEPPEEEAASRPVLRADRRGGAIATEGGPAGAPEPTPPSKVERGPGAGRRGKP